MATILLVGVDPRLTDLTDSLTANGHVVSACETWQAGSAAPDLLLLDAVENVLLVRSRSQTPIIMCCAEQEQADLLLGLKLGADDFVGLPCDLELLEARINAVLRRARRMPLASATDGQPIHVGELVISETQVQATLGGQRLQLTPTEFKLLLTMAKRPVDILSREQLSTAVWDFFEASMGHLVDVHIGRLRQKMRPLSATASLITTVRGRGYTLASVTEPAL